MRPLIAEIVEQLLVRHRADGRVHLNDIDELIGTRAVSYDEVEWIITRLEDQGLDVGEALNEQELGRMRAVLMSARTLRNELGRAPTVDEIADASGHAPHHVRRALEAGQSAGSGTALPVRRDAE